MNLKRPVLYSIGLHIFVILLMVVGMPHFSKKHPLSPPLVQVEMVKIGPKTLIPLKTMEEKLVKPQEMPKPVPKAQPKPEPIKPKTPDPKPDVVQIHNKKEQAKVALKKTPEKLKEPEPSKSKKQADKKKTKTKPKEDDFMSVLNSLEKMPAHQESKSKDTKKTKNANPAGNDITDTLTLSELDALRAQLSRCWALPAGAREAEGLIVEIKVTMNPDATVQQTKIMNESKMSKDPFFQTAAESARRALLDPACSPLLLPANKYNEWREFKITFNPKEMFS